MLTKAIILSAGFGTRMMPLTATIPKPLLPIAGTPIIKKTISKLSSIGIEDIVINIHHLSGRLREELPTPPTGTNIHLLAEPEILGTGGGIKAAQDILGNNDFIVINSDIIAEIDFEKLAEEHKKTKALTTMVLREDKNADRYGSIEIDNNNRIRKFLNKPNIDPSIPLSKYMFTGIQVMSSIFLENIPPNGYCDISKEIYPSMVAANKGLYGFVTKGYWADIGSPAEYLKANFRDLEHLTVTKHNQAKIIPPISIGTNCTIENGAEIGPNCAISADCTIKRGAKIDNTVIMNNVKIGNRAKITGSIIGENISISNNERIAGKIIANLNSKPTTHSIK